MALEQNAQVGVGGAGLQGNGPGTLAAMVKELQGLTIDLLAGAAANTTLPLPAIRQEDTILKAINNSAGTLTDITGTMSIVELKASGTITLAGVTAGQTVTVNGRTYTATTGVASDFSKFTIDGNDTADAASLVAAITAREGFAGAEAVRASNLAAVVTIKAVADGTAGNAIALAKVGAGITLSGATLAGGAATGGVKSTGVTNQVMLHWFNKR